MGRLCRNLSWPKKVCWLIIFNKVLKQLNVSPMGPIIMTLSFRSFVGLLSLSYLEPHSLPKQRHLKLLFLLLAIQKLNTVHSSMCMSLLFSTRCRSPSRQLMHPFVYDMIMWYFDLGTIIKCLFHSRRVASHLFTVHSRFHESYFPTVAVVALNTKVLFLFVLRQLTLEGKVHFMSIFS